MASHVKQEAGVGKCRHETEGAIRCLSVLGEAMVATPTGIKALIRKN